MNCFNLSGPFVQIVFDGVAAAFGEDGSLVGARVIKGVA